MTVTLMNRFSGNADVIEKVWRIHRPIIQKSGATQAELSRIHTGPHTGQFLVLVQCSDWEGHGKMVTALAGDVAFKKAQATLDKSAKLEERTFLRGVAT